MRWVVGDIQGCALELDRLLSVVRFDPTRDELWAAGDLVNRGPESLETLRLWRDLGALGVIGNHDVNALRRSGGRRSRKSDTLDALFRSDEAEELLGLLRALPALVRLDSAGNGPDAWLVHAGVHPDWEDLAATAARLNAEPHDDDWLESDDVSYATRVRFCAPDGERRSGSGPPGTSAPGDVPWDVLYRGDTLIVHGHWARRGYYRGERAMGLDSGCVYGGHLTAWCQEEDRIVQIPSRLR